MLSITSDHKEALSRNEEFEPTNTIDLGRKVCHQAFLALAWVGDNASDSEFFKEYVANDDKQRPSQAAIC